MDANEARGRAYLPLSGWVTLAILQTSSPAAGAGFAEDWTKSKNQRFSKHLTDGDKGLNPCEYWHGGISVRYQHSRRPSFSGTQVSLSSTDRFDVPACSVPSTEVWCFWPCHPRCQAPGEGTGLQTLLWIPGENTSLAQRNLLAQTPQVQKAPCLDSHQRSPKGCGSWMLRCWAKASLVSWQTERDGAEPASTTSTAPVPESFQTIPMLGQSQDVFSQDVFTAQSLQDVFLLAENRAHTKLNEAKTYHLFTLQKRHHHHCQEKTWKPSRRQNNLCSPSRCSESTALSWQHKWIW